MDFFPLDVNRAPYRELLRVPGVGVNSAMRIMTARRTTTLSFDGLKSLGVVLKRAQYFITCGGKMTEGIKIAPSSMLRSLLSEKALGQYDSHLSLQAEQLSLFEQPALLSQPGGIDQTSLLSLPEGIYQNA